MDEIKKVDPLLIFKSAIGSTIAILIASRLNLLYSVTAGIITLLTIQNTKKETLNIALKRIAAFLVAVSLAYVIFMNVGFTTPAFGGFVFIFVALANLLNLQVGVVMNSVLVTHFLVEQRMDLALITNEALILLIGMGMGIIVNSIMPSNEKKIRQEQKVVEDRMRETLNCLSKMLKNRQDCNYVESQSTRMDLLNVEQLIDDLLKKAYEDAGNTLLTETRYQISYLEMRKHQLSILDDIRESIKEIYDQLPHGIKISNYMQKVSVEFTESNNVKDLLVELDELVDFFREESLPKTRQEFENRAILFHILKDLHKFLETKRTFIENY